MALTFPGADPPVSVSGQRVALSILAAIEVSVLQLGKLSCTAQGRYSERHREKCSLLLLMPFSAMATKEGALPARTCPLFAEGEGRALLVLRRRVQYLYSSPASLLPPGQPVHSLPSRPWEKGPSADHGSHADHRTPDQSWLPTRVLFTSLLSGCRTCPASEQEPFIPVQYGGKGQGRGE